MSQLSPQLDELSTHEQRLIAIVRSLHPYERVVISADKEGRPDSYIVERSFKEILITVVQ